MINNKILGLKENFEEQQIMKNKNINSIMARNYSKIKEMDL